MSAVNSINTIMLFKNVDVVIERNGINRKEDDLFIFIIIINILPSSSSFSFLNFYLRTEFMMKLTFYIHNVEY